MALPVYELKIDEEKESFVEAIALVQSPAIESNFLAFSAEQKDLTFSLDEEKKELLGAVMIPNINIYRKREDGFEYNVFFTNDTIRKISQIFFKKGFQSNLNIEHTKEESADSYVFQSLIVDKSKGIQPLNLPDGSWVIGVKVNNESVWKDIKEGKRKGFSVEGVFELIKQDFSIQTHEDRVIALISELTKILTNNNI
jgi:hypothetical protein